MPHSSPPILIVEELITDDCLTVSDSLGLRLLQKGAFLFFDDEIVSGKVSVKLIEEEAPSIHLEEGDVIYYKIYGEYIPKEGDLDV